MRFDGPEVFALRSVESRIPSPESRENHHLQRQRHPLGSEQGVLRLAAQAERRRVCLQETKAQEGQLTDPRFRPDGHHCFYRDAVTRKGYSGVAIYARREPDEVLTEIGWKPFDDEGRYIEARFGNLSVVSLYVPSGTSGQERQQFKFEAMKKLRAVF